MISSTENNKRIAKNTLSLYFRQIIIMAVSIYSSRIVLNALGVVDYGVYNVVGGLIALFGFLNSALAQATQRYIAYGIERDTIEEQRKTFSMLVNIHALLALLIIILCETIGLWFFYEKLVIPEDRMTSAFWVMQCSIASIAVTVLQVPYNASIFGHEKMSAYAYISIVEALFKLATVIVLKYFFTDKLIAYGALQLLVVVIIALTYRSYCIHSFQNCHYILHWSKRLFQKLFSYTGWSLLGNFAYTLNNQGVNILINIFFGPAVNAARGIAVAVESAVSSFLYNFTTASVPAIIKSYAIGDVEYMKNLCYKSSKLGFLLFMCLSIPLISIINPLLNLWLINPPQLSATLCVLSLIYIQINSMNGTLMNVIQATGEVRDYWVLTGVIKILVLPVVYVLYKNNCAVEVYLWALMAVAIICLIIALRIVHKQIPSFSPKMYLIKVTLKEMLSLIIPLSAALYFMHQEYCLIINLVVLCLMVTLTLSSSWMLGLIKSERQWISMIVKEKIKNKFR